MFLQVSQVYFSSFLTQAECSVSKLMSELYGAAGADKKSLTATKSSHNFHWTTAWEATHQSLSALALSWAVRGNLGHMGGAVKCSCSSLTAHAALCIVFVAVPRSGEMFGRRWKEENARLGSESSGWSSFPWARQCCCCQSQRPLASSPAAFGSNAQRRTVKTHPVTGRGTDWEAATQFTSKKEGQKGTLLWLLGPLCSLSSFSSLTCVSACLWVCPTYRPYVNSTERIGRLVTEQHISCPYMLALHWVVGSCICFFFFSRNQRTKAWTQGDKVWKQRTVMQEWINR